MATLILGVAALRVAADDLDGGTAISCSRCSTAAASLATISRKRSTRPEWKCWRRPAVRGTDSFPRLAGRRIRRGTAQDELGDEGDAFAGGDHAGEVIDVQGGGAETRSEPGLPADFLGPDAPRVGVVKSDLDKDFIREVAETHHGTAGELVFGSDHDHKRAAEDFYGLEMPGTGELGKECAPLMPT